MSSFFIIQIVEFLILNCFKLELFLLSLMEAFQCSCCFYFIDRRTQHGTFSFSHFWLLVLQEAL